MKLITRILIILAAAAIIAGATLAIVQLSGANQANAQGFPGGGEGLHRREGAGPGFGGQRPEGAPEGQFERHGQEGEGSGGLTAFGLAGLGRNLAIISSIVVVYWLGDKLFQRIKPHKVI